MNITRRDALRGAAAVAATGATISVAGTPTIVKASDEPLVALWHEAQRCEQELERYDELAGAASARGDRQAFLRFSDQRDEIANRGFAIEKQVSGITPETEQKIHVLPKGFSKIRHFGIYANRSKNKYIDQILMYFERRRKSPKIFRPVQHLKSQYRIDIELCPRKQSKMVPLNPFMPIRGDPAIAINP